MLRANKPVSRSITALAVTVIAAFAPPWGATVAHAQHYPTRPIRIVVPFAAGAGTDLLARLLAQRYTEALGQPAVVENRLGAGGNVGAESVGKAAPDGHTLLFTTTSAAVNVTLYQKLPFDIRRDFVAISQIARSPLIVVTHPSVPARNLRELVDLSKKVQGGLNYGSNGSGTTSHLAVVMLEQFTGTRFTHVPYKGAAPAVTALLSGEVELAVQATTSVLQFVRAGKARPLAVLSDHKLGALPDVPTGSATYRGFEMEQWYMLFAPAGTASAIVTRLHAEAARALQHPEVKGWMQRENSEPVGSAPAEAAAFLHAEVEKYAKIVKASGAKPDQ